MELLETYKGMPIHKDDDGDIVTRENLPVIGLYVTVHSTLERAREYITQIKVMRYNELEDANQDTQNTVELVDMFGTDDEKNEIRKIQERAKLSGYGINDPDYLRSYELHQKYFPLLKT